MIRNRFQIIGPAMIDANKLEHDGVPGFIHISRAVAAKLKGKYIIKDRKLQLLTSRIQRGARAAYASSLDQLEQHARPTHHSAIVARRRRILADPELPKAASVRVVVNSNANANLLPETPPVLIFGGGSDARSHLESLPMSASAGNSLLATCKSYFNT